MNSSLRSTGSKFVATNFSEPNRRLESQPIRQSGYGRVCLLWSHLGQTPISYVPKKYDSISCRYSVGVNNDGHQFDHIPSFLHTPSRFEPRKDPRLQHKQAVAKSHFCDKHTSRGYNIGTLKYNSGTLKQLMPWLPCTIPASTL